MSLANKSWTRSLSLFFVGLLAGMMLPLGSAAAHDPTSWYIVKWIRDKTQNYRFIQGYPSESTYPGWRSRINDANTQWRNQAANVSFTLSSGDATYYAYNQCPGVYGRNSIFYANVSPYLAVVYHCFQATPSTTEMLNAQMVVDNTPFYTGSSSTVPSNQYDLYSTAAHEWGHMYSRVTGGQIVNGATTGHWTESSTQCPETSSRHTMCPTILIGTSWMRSLATHDIDTFNAAYP